MNIKNMNKELGFDDLNNLDFNLHWSFSNYFRFLISASKISELKENARVLEIGAGTSNLSNIVKNHFHRDDIKFIKIDADIQYFDSSEILVEDIMNNDDRKRIKDLGLYDCIVFMEVIEHLEFSPGSEEDLMRFLSSILFSNGLMILTTPTPPLDKKYEDRVWPKDHNYEYSESEIIKLVNEYFKINKEIGWSLEEREFNKALEENDLVRNMYCKLKGCFPESFLRSISSFLVSPSESREILIICKKRREKVKYD